MFSDSFLECLQFSLHKHELISQPISYQIQSKNIQICHQVQAMYRASSLVALSEEDMAIEQKTIQQLKQLLATLDQNITISKTKLKQNCVEMQKIVNSKLKTESYRAPYLLLLIQIYAVKLQQYMKAEQICNSIIKANSFRIEVQIEALLKLSFVLALEGKYKSSIDKIQMTYTKIKTKKRPELEYTISSFFDKIIHISPDSRLFQGHIAADNHEYQRAYSLYSEEFTFLNQSDKKSVLNKYFAARSMLQLIKTLPNQKFEGTSQQKCENFRQKIETDGRYDQTGNSPDTHYHKKKEFIKAIVQFQNRSKSNIQQLYLSYDIFLRLAKLKILKAINSESFEDEEESRILNFILKEIESKSLKNIYMILDFVENEVQILLKLEKMLTKIGTKRVFQLLHSYSVQKKRENEKKSFMIEDEPDPLFEGSYMIKMFEHKGGSQQRYFYINRKQKEKQIYKLYFCRHKDQKKHSDHFYDYTNAQFIPGKKTAVFKRPENIKFREQQCFTLVTREKQINFFVKSVIDYKEWKFVFESVKHESPRKVSAKKIRIKDIGGFQTTSQKRFGFF